jgi:hypothetical protein
MLVACAPDDGERVAEEQSSIINGTLDTVNDAVVAVFSDTGGCTGTLLYAAQGSAYVLTAAHCFGSGPVNLVVRGDNYENPDQLLEVVDYEVHPKYTGDSGDLTYDFAILRAKGASSAVPQILPMSPEEDDLKVGTPIEHSGYGLIKSPDGSTTKRHRAFGTIDQLTTLQLGYNQPKSGPCSGDSGGPQLVDTPFGRRVVGVVSYGDQDCAVFGVSGRVSAVFDSFIVPFVGTLPNAGGSSSSSSVASSSAETSGAGGSSSDASSSVAATGAGGAGQTSGAGASDQWSAGDVSPVKHSGTALSTTCAISTSGDREDATGWWTFAGVSALALAARRSASRERASRRR